ncbi:hypothetical protein KCH_03720 [Kitasatospora cheerisanensis KCTC 2395]|uniref:Uncharacterized protein n=1 Tax=Kitasatospora cheerisanensis KCTC 2395 TaxID=1348663 RepID=A0A066ZC87_9ACTN|nr:hypothetical protein KCH_03720 [Kitasatospora cheerisanensis KCTC 2395]
MVPGEVHFGLQLFGSLLCFVERTGDAVATARAWTERHDPRAGRVMNVSMKERFRRASSCPAPKRSARTRGRRPRSPGTCRTTFGNGRAGSCCRLRMQQAERAAVRCGDAVCTLARDAGGPVLRAAERPPGRCLSCRASRGDRRRPRVGAARRKLIEVHRHPVGVRRGWARQRSRPGHRTAEGCFPAEPAVLPPIGRAAEHRARRRRFGLDTRARAGRVVGVVACVRAGRCAQGKQRHPTEQQHEHGHSRPEALRAQLSARTFPVHLVPRPPDPTPPGGSTRLAPAAPPPPLGRRERHRRPGDREQAAHAVGKAAPAARNTRARRRTRRPRRRNRRSAPPRPPTTSKRSSNWPSTRPRAADAPASRSDRSTDARAAVAATAMAEVGQRRTPMVTDDEEPREATWRARGAERRGRPQGHPRRVPGRRPRSPDRSSAD